MNAPKQPFDYALPPSGTNNKEYPRSHTAEDPLPFTNTYVKGDPLYPDRAVAPPSGDLKPHEKNHHPNFNPQFHNPFDFNSYPMTNPPIFDSTMMVPYTSDGVPRRRRISISNGQIGQIINHEAFFESDGSNLPLDDFLPQGNPPPQTSIPVTDIIPNNSSFVPAGAPAHHHAPQPHQLPQQPPQLPPQPPIDTVLDAAGVPPPNHSLIYNNEVIYNPNNGPIPGTAAWKKERILERNRIAASKCRQRKKKAQQNLQESITKYESEIDAQKAQIDNYAKLVAKYNTYLRAIVSNNTSVPGLLAQDLADIRTLISTPLHSEKLL